MSDYESTRQRHVAHMTARIPEYLDRLTWSAERLRAERDQRLQELLGAARAHSSWHRRRLSTVEVDAIDEDRLRERPVMTKDDLMDHFDEIVTDRRFRLDVIDHHLDGLTAGGGGYLFDRYTAIASSGSSGRRGVFVYDWEEWAVYYLGLHRQLLRAIRDDPSRYPAPVVMARVGASHPTHATASFSARSLQPPMLVHRGRLSVLV